MSNQLNAAEAHVFDVCEFVDAIFGALTTKSRLFDASKRCFDTGQDALIYTNHPNFQTFSDSPDLRDVA